MGPDAAPPGRRHRRAQNPYHHTIQRKSPQSCAIVSALPVMLSGLPPGPCLLFPPAFPSRNLLIWFRIIKIPKLLPTKV
ncbi:hypothetical protein NDU88_000278 [Pleurodeles waltl]|uniref:Uncharacterized protein n=1 Tax=Pleurodeles waltl TaxID=8319 RepID=A0AAV7TEN4_PLEWA|nr:hypothetical protein NDU88_000278 [Pleurodeles waltl]